MGEVFFDYILEISTLFSTPWIKKNEIKRKSIRETECHRTWKWPWEKYSTISQNIPSWKGPTGVEATCTRRHFANHTGTGINHLLGGNSRWFLACWTVPRGFQSQELTHPQFWPKDSLTGSTRLGLSSANIVVVRGPWSTTSTSALKTWVFQILTPTPT